MCMEHSVVCKCGKREASFNFRNEILPPETIEMLYCPECSADIEYNEAKMLRDNGWIITYDMDVASLYSSRLPADHGERISPAIIFDEGYATWRGVYPGDHLDSAKERQELLKLAKTDPRRYFNEMKNWAISRMARLREEGWRKAHEGESVIR